MISIIIPTYNEGKYIEKALLNLKKNLTLPHEVIVSDDHSADDTVAIAQKYADMVVTTEKKHRSIAENRNAGAARARGDFFVFFDSDSWIENPDVFFTHALKNFENNQNLVGLAAPIRVRPETETMLDRIIYSIINGISKIKNNIFGVGEAQGKFMMARASAFRQIYGFRDDLVTSEDVDLFNRLSKVGKTMFDSKLVVYHSGRRAHTIGWHRLLSIWGRERFGYVFLDKSFKKEWKDIR